MINSKRRIFKTILFLFVIIGITTCKMSVYADTHVYDNFEYTILSDGTAKITGYIGTDIELVIPEEVDGYSVSILGSLPTDNNYVKKVTIPGGIRIISDYSYFFSYITDLTICDGVEYIGWDCFAACKYLKEVNIPASVKNIGSSSFRECTSLQAINVDENNKYYCSRDGVLFSKDMTSLYMYPAGKKESEYTIPDSVEKLMNSSFQSCVNLEKLTIQSEVKEIESNPFSNSKKLKEIDVDPDNVFFYDVDGVLVEKGLDKLLCYPAAKTALEYTVPRGIMTIGYHAFYNCKIIKLMLSDSVKRLEWGSISVPQDTMEVIIPGSVTYMSDYALSLWSSTKVYVEKDSEAEKYLTNKNHSYDHISSDEITAISNDSDYLICDYLFPDEELRKELKIYDINSGNSLSKTEREGIVKLEIAERGVKDLTGIEYFPNLKYLDCSGNSLIKLNTGEIPRLEKLLCFDNKIVDLDVSANSKIKVLYCWNNSFDSVELEHISDEDIQGLKYIPADANEADDYSDAYESYKLWGGMVEYDKTKHILNYTKHIVNKPVDNNGSGEESNNDDTSENTDNLDDKANTENADKPDDKTNTENIDKSDNKTKIGKTKTLIVAKSYKKTLGSKEFYINAETNSDVSLKYSSSNSKVATISDKGKVTLKKCGKAKITITAPQTSVYETKTISVNITVVPGRVNLIKASSPQKSQIFFRWKKIPGVTKYQYNISKKKNFKGARIYTTKEISKNITPTSNASGVSGKTFYIRVRAVSKIGGKNYYGKWSKVKYVKVK